MSTFEWSAIFDVWQGSEYTSGICPFCLYCLRSAGSVCDINKGEGRISKRVFQENKARQIFQKTNVFYPLICTRTYYIRTYIWMNTRLSKKSWFINELYKEIPCPFSLLLNILETCFFFLFSFILFLFYLFIFFLDLTLSFIIRRQNVKKASLYTNKSIVFIII